MANIVREELWKHPGHPGMIVVTTNATVTSRNKLVMGRGAAREARNRIVCIDQECGLAICSTGSEYGFLIVRPPTESTIGFGVFQVKDHFKDVARLDLIRLSAAELSVYAAANPDTQIRMNYPGIGCGHLPRAEVEPLLTALPDNVTICYR